MLSNNENYYKKKYFKYKQKYHNLQDGGAMFTAMAAFGKKILSKKLDDPLNLNAEEIALKKTNINEFIKLIFKKSYELLIDEINIILNKLKVPQIDTSFVINPTKEGTNIHLGEPIHCYTITSSTIRLLHIHGNKPVSKRTSGKVFVSYEWVLNQLNTSVYQCILSNSLEDLYNDYNIVFRFDPSLFDDLSIDTSIFCEYIRIIKDKQMHANVMNKYTDTNVKIASWNDIEVEYYGKQREINYGDLY